MSVTGVWGAVTCCTGITINCIRKCINLVFVYIHGHVTEASADRLAMLGVAEASKATCNFSVTHVCYSPLGVDSTDLWDCDRLQGCTVRPVSDPIPYLQNLCNVDHGECHQSMACTCNDTVTFITVISVWVPIHSSFSSSSFPPRTLLVRLSWNAWAPA